MLLVVVIVVTSFYGTRKHKILFNILPVTKKGWSVLYSYLIHVIVNCIIIGQLFGTTPPYACAGC